MDIDFKMLGLVLGLCVASSLITSMVFLSAVDTKFERIDNRLTEIDGRRNAQYGIIKQKIEDK